MHQAGHLHQALQCRLQPIQAERRGTAAKLLVERTDDEAAGLLHLQRVGQAAAHCGIALQRKDLRLLLQAAHRRGIDDAPAIAFQLVDDRAQIALAGAQAGLGLAVRTLTGNLVLEVHGLGHASFSWRDKQPRSLTRAFRVYHRRPPASQNIATETSRESCRLPPPQRRTSQRRSPTSDRTARHSGRSLAGLGRRRAVSPEPAGIRLDGSS